MGRPPYDVHLWYTLDDEITDPTLLCTYEEMLSPEEHARQKGLTLARAGHTYLAARILVRTSLSRYADDNPRDWRFTRSSYGRPEVAAPSEHASLRFSLSHTAGLIVCGIARNKAIGVDVEDISRQIDVLGIAKHCLSPSELAVLRELPSRPQRTKFFEYWTLKESYAKARGLGLFLPFRQVSFDLSGSQPIRIAFNPCLVDDAESWQFAHFRPTPAHMLAVAVRCREPGELSIELTKVSSFLSTTAAPLRT